MSVDSPSWQNPRLAGRIPELDGLRGLAILLILVLHYVVLPAHAAPGSWLAYALAPFMLTWSGVDLFFVLSGFLIGGILYDARASESYYRTFYLRRIHRIFPLYFAWIALFIVGLRFVGPTSASPLRDLFNRDIPTWSYPLFLQNFLMALHQTFGAQWVAMSWSLAVEEQFYLLLPFLVRNLSRRGITLLALVSVLGALAFRLILWSAGTQYIGRYALLPSRADALGFGVLVALVCRSQAAWNWLASHRRLLFAGFLVLGCGFAYLTFHQRGIYVLGLTWIAAFYAILLLLVVVNPGWVETICFRNYWLVKLGIVSYAVYIFHQGTNALLHFAILGSAPGINDWSSLSVTLLSLTVVLSLAALSWRLLEKPLIRRAHSEYRYVTSRDQEAAGASA